MVWGCWLQFSFTHCLFHLLVKRGKKRVNFVLFLRLEDRASFLYGFIKENKKSLWVYFIQVYLTLRQVFIFCVLLHTLEKVEIQIYFFYFILQRWEKTKGCLDDGYSMGSTVVPTTHLGGVGGCCKALKLLALGY